METPLTIRLLEDRDLEAVYALYTERNAYFNTVQLPYQSVDHWRQKMAREGRTNLVAVRGEEVLGQLSVDFLTHPRRRHVATFGMGVKDAARGRGVGRALVRAAIDLCEAWANVSRLEIEVYTDNHSAIALYERCGFVIEGTCRQYAYRDGAFVDAHVMARVRQASANA